MKNNCTIYLVRHGETEWNAKRIIQGHSDIPLNSKGKLQAKQLGEELKNVHFEVVFSSDLLRARDSAEIIVSGKKIKINVEKVLRERFFGRFEGKPLMDFKKIVGEVMLVNKEKQSELNLFDVENDEDIVTRLVPFMQEVVKKYLGKNILMMTHGGLIRAFLGYVGFKIPEYSEKPMKNAGYLIIESDGVEFKIKEEKLF